MTVESAPRPDAIVKETFEVFSGLAGSMSEAEFVEFCEISRDVCADRAKNIFLVVAERPDAGMNLKEFEESLNLLIGLTKSSSGACVGNVHASTRAESHTSITTAVQISQNSRTSKLVLAPRTSCVRNGIQSSPRKKLVVEVPTASVEKATDRVMKVPRCSASLAEGSMALLSLKKAALAARRSVDSASTVSTTASSAGSNRSEASSVVSSPCVSPNSSPRISPRPSPHSFARDPLRLSARVMASAIRRFDS